MLLASLSIEEQLEASGPGPTSIGKDSTDDWVLSTETCFDFRTYFLLGLASSPVSSSVFFCLFLVFLTFSPLSFPFVVLSVSLSSSSSIASEEDFFQITVGLSSKNTFILSYFMIYLVSVLRTLGGKRLISDQDYCSEMRGSRG